VVRKKHKSAQHSEDCGEGKKRSNRKSLNAADCEGYISYEIDRGGRSARSAGASR